MEKNFKKEFYLSEYTGYNNNNSINLAITKFCLVLRKLFIVI